MISPVKIWRNQKQVQEYLGKSGRIVTWTVIRVPPAGFSDQAPYAVGLIKLDNGTQIECQLVEVDFDRLKVGLSVELIIRRIKEPDEDGVIIYGIKAKLK